MLADLTEVTAQARHAAARAPDTIPQATSAIWHPVPVKMLVQTQRQEDGGLRYVVLATPLVSVDPLVGVFRSRDYQFAWKGHDLYHRSWRHSAS